MRPSDPTTDARVAVLIATRDRPAALRRCLESLATQAVPPGEVLVLDNAGEAPPDVSACPAARVLRSEVPLGVAAARLLLLDAATAPVALLLDDDAWLATPGVVGDVRDAFRSDPRLAALALPICDHRYAPARWLTPFGTLGQPPQGTRCPATYFVGGAHALRRDAVQAAGGYDASFVYGGEELELSYRLVARGHTLAFSPPSVVEHRPEPGPRQRFDPERLAHRVRNRIVLAWRHLPTRYAGVHVASWLALYLLEAVRNGALRAFARGLRDGVRDARTSARAPMQGDALAYLKAHGGRLWK